MRNNYLFIRCSLLSLVLYFSFSTYAQYSETAHRQLRAGEIPVSEPGNYGESGKTYVLINNISSPRSAIFLGENTTLDLNGYEITYADASYEHIPNYGFEDGLTRWNFTKAPLARIVGKQEQVFVGEKALELNVGEQITSEYINLPIANRSYFAMCGIAKKDMRISIYIEYENGAVVQCSNEYGVGILQGCPVENKTVQLGGGFAYAHMVGQPAGKYRVRIKAMTKVIIDQIDIRPSMDVGIGIMARTWTNCHTDHMYAGYYDPSFYDYSANYKTGLPLTGIPVVSSSASGNITIKNGTVRSGAKGILSWGIQSMAESPNLKIVLDNVKVVSSGINTEAFKAFYASITNCYFDIDNPFIINRHNTGRYAVDLVGKKSPSEVSHTEFLGGQGCLTISGINSLIHDNVFKNRQTVTNHYSVAVSDGAKVYNNLFRPITGSGIGIGKTTGVEVYDNEIHIESAPPTCEYGHEDYSVNGVRFSDYNAAPGSAGCKGNKVYRNKFYITGKAYPEYPDYLPVATAIFYSASAGDNFVYDNEVVVDSKDPNLKGECAAFYIGGGTIGGEFKNNKVTTNVPAFWIASPYGKAENVRVIGNTITKAAGTSGDFFPVRLGSGGYLATDIEFRSNIIEGAELNFTGTLNAHTYSVFWTLTVNVLDKDGQPIKDKGIEILNKHGNSAFKGKSSETGTVNVELREYNFIQNLKQMDSPYRVIIGEQEVPVTLDKNIEINILGESVNISELSENKGFTFFPNPVQSNLRINFLGDNNNSRRVIEIRDIYQKVHSSIVSTDKDMELDLSSLVPGIYFLRVGDDKKAFAEKIVKL